MKKMLSMILTILLLVSVFPTTVLGDSTVSIEVTPQFAGNRNGSIEISWQPCPAHSLFSTNEARVAYLETRIREWCEQNPDVKINIIETTSNNVENMAKTLIQVTEGRAADVVSIDSYAFPNFVQYAQPMTDVFDKYGIEKDDFFPFVQDAAYDGDTALGLWYTTDVRSLYYRKDLIPTPPATWAELQEMAIGVTEEYGIDGYLFPGGKNENLVLNSLIFFWAMGGELVDGDKPIFADGENYDRWIKVMEHYTEMVNSGASPARVITLEQPPLEDMVSGSVAFDIDGNFVASSMKNMLGLEAYNALWGVAPIPMPEEGMHMNVSGGWINTIFTTDEVKRQTAADFVTYIYGDNDGMNGWCSNGGYLPTRKPVYEVSEYFSSDPEAQFFKSELDFANVRPAAPIYQTISAEMSNYISEYLSGSMTAQEALDTARDNVNKAYEAMQ